MTFLSQTQHPTAGGGAMEIAARHGRVSGHDEMRSHQATVRKPISTPAVEEESINASFEIIEQGLCTGILGKVE